MYRPAFEAVIDMLPMNNVEVRELVPESNDYFGVIPNQDGSPRLIIREQTNELDYTKQKPEFEKMRAHGVKVVKHSPFIAAYNQTFVVTDYVDGPRLDVWLAEDPNPERCRVVMDHVGKLARYYAESSLEGQGPLVDVSSEFQYLMADEETPTLVDLDSSVGGYAEANDALRSWLAGYHLSELGFAYGLILPESYIGELKHTLEEVYTSRTGESLFIRGTTDIDHDRFLRLPD